MSGNMQGTLAVIVMWGLWLLLFYYPMVALLIFMVGIAITLSGMVFIIFRNTVS